MSNIHEKCKGCDRIDDNQNCLVYINPLIWWQEDNKYKEYCPLATHYTTVGEEIVGKKRVGQQKQKKGLR